MLINVEIVTNLQRLRAVGAAWNTLWRPSDSVFQSHPWLIAWAVECPDVTLRVACAWSEHRLIAVLPLCIRRWHGLRVLEWAAQTYSDYCDAILPSRCPMVLEAMWKAVCEAGQFDFARLKHIRPDAIVQPFLQKISTEERAETCLQVVRQWPNGHTWFRHLNKKTRNNFTRGKRILGEVVFRQLCDDEPWKPVVARLLHLKRQRPENRAAPLVRSETALVALTEALHTIGSLRIFVMERDGTVIAGSINAVHHGKMLALFATYDTAEERGSPGILLMTEYTIWGFNHGMTEIDYLLGDEPYKFRYANREIKLHIFVVPQTLRGRLAIAAYRHLRPPPEPSEIVIGSAYLTAKGTRREPQSEIVETRRWPVDTDY